MSPHTLQTTGKLRFDGGRTLRVLGNSLQMLPGKCRLLASRMACISGIGGKPQLACWCAGVASHSRATTMHLRQQV